MMTPEYGRFCPNHPASKREILPTGMEGLVIEGVNCEFWKVLNGMGYQSMCCAADRVKKGCK